MGLQIMAVKKYKYLFCIFEHCFNIHYMETVDLNPVLQGHQTNFNSGIFNGLVVYCCYVWLAGLSLKLCCTANEV
jgi:hypothetical protein